MRTTMGDPSLRVWFAQRWGCFSLTSPTLRVVAIVLCLAFNAPCQAQAPAAAQPMKRLLVLGEEKGYRHESVSHAMATIERLGHESGLWTTTIRTDTEVLTKKKLEYNAKTLNDFEAVVFYTGG